MIRVYLAGEGPSELGSRSGHLSYQSDATPGVLQVLLRAVQREGWEVVGAVNWKDIRKLRVNAPGTGDARNVLAASLKAKEAGASALVFTRDRDRDEGRERVIEQAIVEAERNVSVAGAVATESIEAWLLALSGETKSEAVRHPEKKRWCVSPSPRSTPLSTWRTSRSTGSTAFLPTRCLCFAGSSARAASSRPKRSLRRRARFAPQP